MRGRRRSRDGYRVYAEDDFLGVEDPSAEGATLDGGGLDDTPHYTAAPRGLPRPLGGRVGVALVALVAMVVSALVVHALRAGLAGGGAARRSMPAAVAAAATPTSKGSSFGGARGTGQARRDSGRAARANPTLRGEAARRRDRAVRVLSGGMARAVRSGAGQRAPDSIGAERTQDTIPSSGLGEAGPASTISAAIPEFGFERQ
jgi:hypothetical protein